MMVAFAMTLSVEMVIMPSPVLCISHTGRASERAVCSSAKMKLIGEGQEFWSRTNLEEMY